LTTQKAFFEFFYWSLNILLSPNIKAIIRTAFWEIRNAHPCFCYIACLRLFGRRLNLVFCSRIHAAHCFGGSQCLSNAHCPCFAAMTFVSDEALTQMGHVQLNQGRILLIACGALAREILTLKEVNAWQHFDLQCLPANLHLSPDRIPDAVEKAVTRYREAYEKIFVLYADCGTGGLLQARCAKLDVEMMAGPHCYSFFEGNDTFSKIADQEFTAFYLTDFLVRQFDAFVWRPMGLDRHPELRDIYFGNYTKLVYQAQTNDPALDAKAECYAVRLGLSYERRFTGYGDLYSEMAAI
jgi:hypothetical protein